MSNFRPLAPSATLAATAMLLATAGVLCPAAAATATAGDAQAATAAGTKTPGPMDPVAEREELPRVLLIGDSISIGYTVPVRQRMADQANVLRPRTNCGPTTRGLEGIDQWLGDKPWDVIHFNFGLHDLKYMGPEGQNLADPQSPSSHPQVPIDQYRANLERLVQRLQQTGAQLIWCTTTPVPPGAQGRVVGDAARYNAAARKVMRQHGVAIDDLYSVAKPRLSEIQRPANVHFTPEGSALLARHVARSIRQALRRANTQPADEGS